MSMKVGYTSEGGEKVLRAIKEFFVGHKFEPRDYELYKQLRVAWAEIDVDQTGYVGMKELKTHLDKMGKHVSKESLKLAFDTLDRKHTGHVTFEDFAAHNGLKLTKAMWEKIAKMEEQDTEGITFKRRPTDGHGHVVRDDEDNPLLRLPSQKSLSQRQLASAEGGDHSNPKGASLDSHTQEPKKKKISLSDVGL